MQDSKDTNVSTGSGMTRWHVERKLAMQITKEFRDLKYRSNKPEMTLVWAGCYTDHPKICLENNELFLSRTRAT